MTLTFVSAEPRLADLAAGVRNAINAIDDADQTARLAADQLHQHLPGPQILTPEQRMGDPDGYRAHLLHVEPDGAFSILGLVWRPGQVTRIHDQSAGVSSASSRASNTRSCSTRTSSIWARTTTTPAT
jgi:predicted metal-dependent enzyme (double-stranded beta helix superfamily)